MNPIPVKEQFPPYELAERHLHAGTVQKGCEALARRLAAVPRDQPARFALGILQFLGAFERLSQSLYAAGAADGALRRALPILEQVPANPQPRELSYDELRSIAERFLDDVRRADASFDGVRDVSVKLPLRLGPGRLDLDGDGVPERPLKDWLTSLRGPAGRLDPELLVCFDRGDAAWFRGYCNLLAAGTCVLLAYDQRELFDRLGHLLFPRIKTPFGSRVGFGELLDLAALVHLARFPVRDPEMLRAALGHLETAVEQDLESWDHILAETDDDHEWIPSPRQTGALGVPVSAEMVETWRRLLRGVRELLAGRLLLPFWRGGRLEGRSPAVPAVDGAKEKAGLGINVRRLFTEPQPFDLVLWVQGLGVVQYLEEGRVASTEELASLRRVFGRNLAGFALWFN